MSFFFSLKPWVQIIISGFITGLSFHPFNIGFFSWFSFIPLFHIFLISNLKLNLFNGYVFGLSFNLTAFYWIGSNSGADSLTVIGSLSNMLHLLITTHLYQMDQEMVLIFLIHIKQKQKAFLRLNRLRFMRLYLDTILTELLQ